MISTPKEDPKLATSIVHLEEALHFLDKAKKNPVYSAAISKTYEICLEYAWKYLKKKIVGEGLETYSPKETIKHAGRLGFVDDVEKWLGYLQDRNLAVHDYLGIDNADYVKTIQSFLMDVKKLIKK